MLEDRLGLITAEERVNMGTFIEKKVYEANEGNLDCHYSIDELVDL